VRPAAVKLLAELRSAGIPADMDYRSRKFGAQAKRADDLGARYLLILGDSEVEKASSASVIRVQRSSAKSLSQTSPRNSIPGCADGGEE